MATKLFYNNLLDTSNTSSIDEDSTYPDENLVSPNYAEVWRSQSLTLQYISIDLGSAMDVSCVFVGNLNINSTATLFAIRGNSTSSFSSPEVDEDITITRLNGYHRCVYHDLAATYNKQYWRLYFVEQAPPNPDGYYEIGNIGMGVPIVLGDNWDSNNTRRLVHSDVLHQTEYRQTYVYQRDFYWVFDLNFTNITEATVEQLKTLKFTQEGRANPFALVIDDTDPAECYYVRMEGELGISRVSYNRYSVSMSFVEEAPGVVAPR